MTVPVNRWATFAPPRGWRWYRRPRAEYRGSSDGGGRLMMEAAYNGDALSATQHLALMQDLETWAREHDIYVSDPQPTTIRYGNRRASAPYLFNIRLDWSLLHQRDGRPTRSYFRPRACPECQTEHSPTALDCTNCGRHLWCNGCVVLRWGVREGTNPYTLGIVEGDGDERPTGCTNCYPLCRAEGVECRKLVYGNWRRCREHTVIIRCDGCSTEMDSLSTQEVAGRNFCVACSKTRCHDCGATGAKPDAATMLILCQTCREARNRGREEEWDDIEVTPESLMIPALPARPVRLLGIEQEFVTANGDREVGSKVARLLHKKGICWSPERLGYHAGNHTFPCHVEYDRSVEDGGELVYNRLRLDTEQDAGHFASILQTVRDEVKKGQIKFDVRCGTHLHIDLHGYTVGDTRTLATVFGYLEDPVFRLGAANYGEHRSVIHSGMRYTMPIRKGKWKNNADFGREFLYRAEHTDALNLMWYFRAIKQNCKCGAIEFGEFAECKCNLGKCTAEWRVFNGTSNPVMLHAWCALAQSLTAYCQGREVDPDQFESLTLEHKLNFSNPTMFTAAHHDLIEKWKVRLAWIFQNLTFTDAERGSLMYCVRNSVLKHTGDEFVNSLLNLPRIADTRTLTAPIRCPRDQEKNPEYCPACGEDWGYCECNQVGRGPFVEPEPMEWHP